MSDVMPKAPVDSPPSSPSEGGYSSDEAMNPVEREKYRLQVMESCGFDVDFFMHIFNGIVPCGCTPVDTLCAKAGIHCYNMEKDKNLQFKNVVKVNAEIASVYNSYTTSVVMDPVDNSLQTFQACVTDAGRKNKARLVLITKICRLKPLIPGPGDVNTFWDFDAIDDFYKGDLPEWPSLNDDKVDFYEVKESELGDNDWLYLYAEAALFSNRRIKMGCLFAV